MIKYKMDIMQALKNKGITSYKIRKDNIFGQQTLTDFRKNNVIGSVKNIDLLCKLLEIQPGDLLEYIPDDIPK